MKGGEAGSLQEWPAGARSGEFRAMPARRGAARGEEMTEVAKDKAFRDRTRIENNLRLHRQHHPVLSASSMNWLCMLCVGHLTRALAAGVRNCRAGGESS